VILIYNLLLSYFILFTKLLYCNYILIFITCYAIWSLIWFYFYTSVIHIYVPRLIYLYVTCNYIVTNVLHTLCNLYHYDCFHICKDLMEGENKYANMQIQWKSTFLVCELCTVLQDSFYSGTFIYDSVYGLSISTRGLFLSFCLSTLCTYSLIVYSELITFLCINLIWFIYFI